MSNYDRPLFVLRRESTGGHREFYLPVTYTKPNIQSFKKWVRFMQITRYRPALLNRNVISCPFEVGPAGIVPPFRNCIPPADMRRPGSDHTRLSGCTPVTLGGTKITTSPCPSAIVCCALALAASRLHACSAGSGIVAGSVPGQRYCPIWFRVVSLLTSRLPSHGRRHGSETLLVRL